MLSCCEQEITSPKMAIPESVVSAGMKAFEEAYNQGNYEFCGSCYTDECHVVVSECLLVALTRVCPASRETVSAGGMVQSKAYCGSMSPSKVLLLFPSRGSSLLCRERRTAEAAQRKRKSGRKSRW